MGNGGGMWSSICEVNALLSKLDKLPEGGTLGRFELLPLIPADADILEIGPAHSPCFNGSRTKYFDVIDSAGIKQRVIDLNIEEIYGDNGSRIPEHIDYVSPVADLTIVDKKFDFVFSSHAIEHQVDIISHLAVVGSILKPGGAYIVICPDRRFCFDANRPPSTLGQVIESHEIKRARHSLSTIVDASAYPSHNDGARHWAGDTPAIDEIPVSAVLDAINQWRYSEENGHYLDRHAWQFTPSSFRLICDFLRQAQYVNLVVSHIFDPPHPANEFIAVMLKPELS